MRSAFVAGDRARGSEFGLQGWLGLTAFMALGCRVLGSGLGCVGFKV